MTRSNGLPSSTSARSFRFGEIARGADHFSAVSQERPRRLDAEAS
jgi:hypothetical protein